MREAGWHPCVLLDALNPVPAARARRRRLHWVSWGAGAGGAHWQGWCKLALGEGLQAKQVTSPQEGLGVVCE